MSKDFFAASHTISR